MASFELLERLRTSAHREQTDPLEHKPPRERVAAEDIVRIDELGRRVVVCPAGQVPDRWLRLTSEERDGLVEPPEPVPDDTLEIGRAGVTPRNTVLGSYTIGNGETW